MRRALSAATSRASSKAPTPEPEGSTAGSSIDLDDESVGKAVPKEQKAGWAAWCEHPEVFAAIRDGKTEQDRLLNVLRWFISSLKGSYTARNASMGSEKKPLNPILGELFLGHWPGTDRYGETQLISEQVSHHPPITAFYIENAKAGVSFQGHCAQKTSFTGRAIQVRQIGHGKITFTPDGASKPETYIITLPHLVIEGLLFGSPYVELSKTSYICSSTGLTAKIDYSGKGYFSGKAHSFKATIHETADSLAQRPLSQVEGSWTGESFVKSGAVASKPFWNAATPRSELVVKPIAEQGEMESRRVWQQVAEGIRNGDSDVASRSKAKIENEQRSKRKNEASVGRPHQLKYFDYVDEDLDYAQFTAPLKRKEAREDTYRFKG
ncbi:Oxysterol-binding protein 4 [Tilletia horrida]|nr:Oxysterol-binding protein 4 [Tilletia horrida]KAK0567976.1 Oxysterol-binding protein 4 [Tilletia horrida]